MSELDKLKRKRTTHKGLCTKLINSINTKLQEDGEDLNLLQDFESLMQRLTIKEKEIYEVENEIECIIEDLDELEKELESRQEYRDQIIEIKVKLISKIENSKTTNVPQHVENDFRSDHRQNVRTEKPTFVKLPKIAIPIFDGSPDQWTEFWSQYSATVHENSTLSNVEKFVYLRSFLKPPASTAIAGYELSDKNYDSAIDTLKSRFGKKDIVIRYKIDTLLNLSPVKSANLIKELRSLHDALDVNIKSLENLGVDLKSYGNLLFPIVTKLIPTSIMIEYNKMKSENDEWDVRDLLEHLKLEVQTREKTFLFLKRETETISSGHKNLNLKSQNRPSANNEDYYKKSNSGYRSKFNTPQKTSAFKITVSKCIFCADTANDHESEMCKMNIEDKKLSLRKQGICYLCLKRGKHVAKFCLSGIKCDKCFSAKHNSLICYKQDSESQKKDENSNKPPIETPQMLENSSKKNTHESENVVLSYKCSVQNPNKNNEIFLQTCFARIKNNFGTNTKNCVILYDSASQRNFISKKLAEELKLPIIKKETLVIYPFSLDQPQQKEYSLVSFELSNLENPEEKCSIEALVVEQISFTKLRVATDVKNILSNKQNRNKFFSSMKLLTPDVLIGASLFFELLKYKRKINHSLYAVNTRLGWTISGSNTEIHPCDLDASVFKIECCNSNDLNENCGWVNNNDLNCTAKDVQNLWTLDSIGICDDKALSITDQEIIKNFEEQLEFKEGRYFTRLLWNDECAGNLDNNFQNAKRQFDILRKRLQKDKWIFEEYKRIINDQKSLGIVEECERTDKEYFAPHREVIRNDKQTTKVRIVFNCSSKNFGNKSLNDCLLKGPCLTPLILDVIIKFRIFKIAFTADIEKAFLMIGIKETDRNYLKFLWFGDEAHDYKIMRIARCPFGCTSSSFSLTATIKKHIRDYSDKYPDSYEMLNSALFVDDLVYGSNTVEKAYELTTDAVNILQGAGMKLRKFNTNSEKLKALWNRNGYAADIINDDVVSVLGILWDKNSDTLSIELKSIVENLDISVCTKRYVLHTAAKFFDPIGIISPFLIRIKCLLQKIWQRGIEWDHELPEDIKRDWVRWCYEIEDLLELRIDRCHFSRIDYGNSQIELHIFSDASPLAYGCVAYFKVISNKRECFVSMVMSKARVAPLKKITLPRLELMGAVLAARIGKYICNVFSEITVNRFYWTDSSIVLHWLKGSAKEWKPFVKNRIVEIQTISEPENWAYCPTKENPADLVTRGVMAKVLINNDFWFKGPKWLSEVDGRSDEIDDEVETRYFTEERRKKPEKIVQFVCPSETVELILNLDNYSDIIKVFRITAWVKRFLNNANPKNESKCGPLSAEEINSAQRVWVKVTQELSFPNELNCLKNAKTIPKNSSLIEFSPFLDNEQIMRIDGRLGKSKFSFTEKHPILLPSKGKFIELLIRHAHEKVFHFGVNDTLVQLREQFWIIKGRQAVKSVLKKCTICRKFNSRSGEQIMAPLPEDRIQEQKPFSIIGLDFAGPVYVRNNATKHYILLCTCAVTRSVHLEVVDNLSTETFLMAFRRMVARRGLCHTVYSDNAKTFHRAEKELRGIWKIINHQDVRNYYGSNGIKWKFIVEMSPWWGGFYERIVRSIKSALRKVVGKTTLTSDQLHTVITEIEATINSRPMTYVFSDSREPAPITPAHFLVGQRLTALPMVHIKTSSFPTTSKEFVRRYNYKERLLQQFWTRWKTEYLLQLKSALTIRPSRVFEFSVGDVVLINDPKLPRHLWKLGLVTEVYSGRDGKIRSCLLKTSSGTVKRPFQLLYPLELTS